MKTLKKKLGFRIQEIRKSRKMTQEVLAEKIDLDIPNLSNIETGKRFLTAETLEKIAAALDVDEKDLFDFGHIKARDELLFEINAMASTSEHKELQYIHRALSNLKQLQK